MAGCRNFLGGEAIITQKYLLWCGPFSRTDQVFSNKTQRNYQSLKCLLSRKQINVQKLVCDLCENFWQHTRLRTWCLSSNRLDVTSSKKKWATSLHTV